MKDKQMSMKRNGGMVATMGENWNTAQKDLSWCHCVYHKFHMQCPGFKPRSFKIFVKNLDVISSANFMNLFHPQKKYCQTHISTFSCFWQNKITMFNVQANTDLFN